MNSFKSHSNKEFFLGMDKSGREICYYRFDEASFFGENIFYPNVLIKCSLNNYTPYEEKTMSLSKLESIKKDYIPKDTVSKVYGDFFFFVYNTDNYFHFIYDTLPYLNTYFYVKTKNPNLKLLMNYPNPSKKENYRFVDELLELIGINKYDIEIIQDDILYEKIYVSNSFTYGENPNMIPHIGFSEIYNRILNKVEINKNYPEKIYISRRTWVHNDLSNIGTNYTTRRKMVNEDQLVNFLVSEGYEEVFTETLSTIEKISLFYNTKKVVGPIGGGLCNVLFSKKTTELISIVSPTFLDVNERLCHCLNNVNVFYFNETSHSDSGYWKKYMRIRFENKVGEIEEIYDNELMVSYLDDTVSGWSSCRDFKRKIVDMSNCSKLDDGLNSPWIVNIDELKKYI